jgi:amidase
MTADVTWQVLSAAHRAKQVKAIPPEWLLQPEILDKLRGANTEDEGKLLKLDVVSKSGLLDQRDLDLTENSTAREVLDRLSRGELASEDVVRAYCKRASLAHQLVLVLPMAFFSS